jgi:hypothetical protein
MVGEQIVGARVVAASSKPVVEQRFELGVEWDVAVAVQLANGHPEPVCRADLHDGVDGQVDELATTQTSAGQHLDAQTHKRVSVCPRGEDVVLCTTLLANRPFAAYPALIDRVSHQRLASAELGTESRLVDGNELGVAQSEGTLPARG